MHGPRATKLAAHEYLDRLGIGYRALSFPPETTPGAANVARALGCSARQMVKTLIFESHTGERVLVMVGGDQNAISGHLKRAIGSRNIRMAAPEAVLQTTGYEVGSIPPFSWQPEGLRSLLDDSLLHETELGVGAGRWGEEIMIAPHDLVRAARAQVVNLCNRSRPRPGDD